MIRGLESVTSSSLIYGSIHPQNFLGSQTYRRYKNPICKEGEREEKEIRIVSVTLFSLTDAVGENAVSP